VWTCESGLRPTGNEVRDNGCIGLDCHEAGVGGGASIVSNEVTVNDGTDLICHEAGDDGGTGIIGNEASKKDGASIIGNGASDNEGTGPIGPTSVFKRRTGKEDEDPLVRVYKLLFMATTGMFFKECGRGSIVILPALVATDPSGAVYQEAIVILCGVIVLLLALVATKPSGDVYQESVLSSQEITALSTDSRLSAIVCAK
jgi:hypothetical protein